MMFLYLLLEKNGTVTDNELETFKLCAEKAKNLASKMFDSLPPKMYAVAKHLVKDVKKFKGIGEFTEDFMEHDHQIGKKDEERTKAVRSRKKAFQIQAKQEEIRNLPGIKEHELTIKQSSSQKQCTIMDTDTCKLQKAEKRYNISKQPPLEYVCGTIR